MHGPYGLLEVHVRAWPSHPGFLATWSLALAACGASGPAASPPICDVLAQTGCAAGEKCAWVRTTSSTGATACVPAGAKTLLQACTWGAAGSSTGYDDCAKGFTCQGGYYGGAGECLPNCWLGSTAGPGSGCLDIEACMAEPGPFSGTTPAIGQCQPACDPLTQVRLADNAPACGSWDPARPDRGCYGLPGWQFMCSSAGDPSATHRVPVPTTQYGIPINGCAPGYLPLLRDQAGSTTVMCIALCSPLAAWQGNTAGLDGEAPHTCAAAGATSAGEECRFWSYLEGPTRPITPWSNSLGYCYDHTRYTWDDDQNASTPPVPTPSCGDLTSTDANSNGLLDYLEWGCGPISSR